MQRKGPLPGKIFARCILRRRFAGLFGYMARTSCQSQPVFGCMARRSCHELAIFPSEAAFGMHGAQNLPRIAARERTAAESCHGKTPGNAPRKYIATAGQAKSASGRSPATVGRSGTHSVDILPSPDIRERTASAYSHCQSSGRATFSTRGSGFRPLAALWGSARNTFCARGGHSAFSGLNCWERFRVCAVSVGNHEPASRSAKLCRIMC